jgi:hypothetical protein
MKGPKKLALALVAAITTLAAVRLVRAGLSDSMDFNVYWRAAQTWAGHGHSPYLFGPAERGFVFKYPPWILPLFFPLGFIGETASRALWAILELFCLGYSVWKLIRFHVAPRVAVSVAFAFWWIWLAHFYAGQFTIFLMAAALWAIPEDESQSESNRETDGEKVSSLRMSALGILFTSKVFSLISMLGLLPQLLRRKTVLTALGLVFSLNFIFIGWMRLHGDPTGVIDLYQQWAHAAGSGGQELGEIVIRGQMNHGFTAGILRGFHVSAQDTWIDPWVALGLGAILSLIWYQVARVRKLHLIESWVGWLGVGLVVHPLAWHHSFVLAYPLCAVALDRAIRTKNVRAITFAVLGIACIGILIPNVIGPYLVRPLELVSIKSWGVSFAATALALASPRAWALKD